MQRPWLSVIVPIYNEEAILPEFLRRLFPVVKGLGRSYEILFVNDGSTDRSLDVLLEAQKREPGIVILDFNRNFGQHSAVFACFEESRGEFVITIDADLQNPPEEIPKIVAKFDEGYDCVGTVRHNRQDSQFRLMASNLVNKITRRLTGIHLHDYGCMMRGYGREVVDSMVRTKEISTFIPALGASFARRVCEVEVAHAARYAGSSKYNFFNLLSLQFDLLTSFSLKPIRFLTFLGLGIAALSVCFGLYLGAMRLIYGPAWGAFGIFSLFAVLFLFVGAQFVVLGLIGEYIGRIYMQVRERPRFIVRQIYRSPNAEPQHAEGPGKALARP